MKKKEDTWKHTAPESFIDKMIATISGRGKESRNPNGCRLGGNMIAEEYADFYWRYATFCHDYSVAHLNKIASGRNGVDTHWMEVLMKNIPHNLMLSISVPYYTIP